MLREVPRQPRHVGQGQPLRLGHDRTLPEDGTAGRERAGDQAGHEDDPISPAEVRRPEADRGHFFALATTFGLTGAGLVTRVVENTAFALSSSRSTDTAGAFAGTGAGVTA